MARGRVLIGTCVAMFAGVVGLIVLSGGSGNTTLEKLPDNTEGSDVLVSKINDFNVAALQDGIHKGTIATANGETITCFVAKSWGISERGYAGLSCDFSQVKGGLEFGENAKMTMERINTYDLDRLNDGLYKATITENGEQQTECLINYSWSIDRGYAGMSCKF